MSSCCSVSRLTKPRKISLLYTLQATANQHVATGARLATDPTWHVISRSGVAKFTNCYTLFTFTLLYLLCCSKPFQHVHVTRATHGIPHIINELTPIFVQFDILFPRKKNKIIANKHTSLAQNTHKMLPVTEFIGSCTGAAPRAFLVR